MLYKVKSLNTGVLYDISNSPETELCKIMNKYGSDKGNGHHNYTKLYSTLFSDIRDAELNVLEIGIGSVNPNILSNMCGCRGYKSGASQLGWKEYFPNAKIYACDIDRDILDFNDDRIEGFYIDQTDIKGVIEAFNSDELKDIKFDIIVDDGLHAFNVNWPLMKILLSKLKDTGIYIIEDLLDFDQSKADNIEGYYWKYIQLPNRYNHIDNNLIITVKE